MLGRGGAAGQPRQQQQQHYSALELPSLASLHNPLLDDLPTDADSTSQSHTSPQPTGNTAAAAATTAMTSALGSNNSNTSYNNSNNNNSNVGSLKYASKQISNASNRLLFDYFDARDVDEAGSDATAATTGQRPPPGSSVSGRQRPSTSNATAAAVAAATSRLAIEALATASQHFVHTLHMHRLANTFFAPCENDAVKERHTRDALERMPARDVHSLVVSLLDILEAVRVARERVNTALHEHNTAAMAAGGGGGGNHHSGGGGAAATTTGLSLLPPDLGHSCDVSFSLMSTLSTASMARPPVHETNKLAMTRDGKGNMMINRYLVLANLGRGAYGAVKLGEEADTGRKVAIKIVNKRQLKRKIGVSAAESESALRREIAVMKKVRHRNCVSLYEVIDDPVSQQLYLIMDYIPNGPVVRLQEQSMTPTFLQQVEAGACIDGVRYNAPLVRCVVRRRGDAGATTALSDAEVHRGSRWFACKPLRQTLCATFLRQLVSGLRYLHKRNVVHHDIKPDNILLGYDHHVYFTDFGVSEIMECTADVTADEATSSSNGSGGGGADDERSGAATHNQQQQQQQQHSSSSHRHGRRRGSLGGNGGGGSSHSIDSSSSASSLSQHNVTRAAAAAANTGNGNLRSASRGARLGAGTLVFTAPELLDATRSPSDVDPFATDVWALGVTLYCMLVGCAPFNGNVYREVVECICTQDPPWNGHNVHGAPLLPEWHEVLQGMLDKDPARRWLLADLKDYLDTAAFQAALRDERTREARTTSLCSTMNAASVLVGGAATTTQQQQWQSDTTTTTTIASTAPTTAAASSVPPSSHGVRHDSSNASALRRSARARANSGGAPHHATTHHGSRAHDDRASHMVVSEEEMRAAMRQQTVEVIDRSHVPVSAPTHAILQRYIAHLRQQRWARQTFASLSTLPSNDTSNSNSTHYYSPPQHYNSNHNVHNNNNNNSGAACSRGGSAAATYQTIQPSSPTSAQRFSMTSDTTTSTLAATGASTIASGSSLVLAHGVLDANARPGDTTAAAGPAAIQPAAAATTNTMTVAATTTTTTLAAPPPASSVALPSPRRPVASHVAGRFGDTSNNNDDEARSAQTQQASTAQSRTVAANATADNTTNNNNMARHVSTLSATYDVPPRRRGSKPRSRHSSNSSASGGGSSQHHQQHHHANSAPPPLLMLPGHELNVEALDAFLSIVNVQSTSNCSFMSSSCSIGGYGYGGGRSGGDGRETDMLPQHKVPDEQQPQSQQPQADSGEGAVALAATRRPVSSHARTTTPSAATATSVRATRVPSYAFADHMPVALRTTAAAATITSSSSGSSSSDGGERPSSPSRPAPLTLTQHNPLATATRSALDGTPLATSSRLAAAAAAAAAAQQQHHTHSKDSNDTCDGNDGDGGKHETSQQQQRAHDPTPPPLSQRRSSSMMLHGATTSSSSRRPFMLNAARKMLLSRGLNAADAHAALPPLARDAQHAQPQQQPSSSSSSPSPAQRQHAHGGSGGGASGGGGVTHEGAVVTQKQLSTERHNNNNTSPLVRSAGGASEASASARLARSMPVTAAATCTVAGLATSSAAAAQPSRSSDPYTSPNNNNNIATTTHHRLANKNSNNNNGAAAATAGRYAPRNTTATSTSTASAFVSPSTPATIAASAGSGASALCGSNSSSAGGGAASAAATVLATTSSPSSKLPVVTNDTIASAPACLTAWEIVDGSTRRASLSQQAAGRQSRRVASQHRGCSNSDHGTSLASLPNNSRTAVSSVKTETLSV